MASRFRLVLFALLTPFTHAHTPNQSTLATTCPTITATTTEPYCPKTAKVCPIPDIIVEDFVTIPCGCPSTVPTSTSYIPCPTTDCYYSVPTSYSTGSLSCSTNSIVKPTTACEQPCICPSGKICNCPIITAPPCPTPNTTITPPPSPTYTSNTCFTITTTGGTACPTPLTGCGIPQCDRVETATISCGCSKIRTATTCASVCHGGCRTSWKTVPLPCPINPSSH